MKLSCFGVPSVHGASLINCAFLNSMQREKKYQIEERQTELDTGFHPGLLELENDKPLKDNFQNLDIVTCCYFMH